MQQMVSYVKVILPSQPITDRTCVFVRADGPLKVNSILKAEYLAPIDRLVPIRTYEIGG